VGIVTGTAKALRPVIDAVALVREPSPDAETSTRHLPCWHAFAVSLLPPDAANAGSPNR